MKIKKIIAAMLAASITLSAAPLAFAEESENVDKMLYMEDFESDEYDKSIYDIPSSISSKYDYFSQELVTEKNGNKAMKYLYTSTDMDYQSGVGGNIIQRGIINSVEIKTDGTAYEVSFSFKPSRKGMTMVPSMNLLLNYGGGYGVFGWDANDRGPVVLGKMRNQDRFLIDHEFKGYITVKAVLDIGNNFGMVQITGEKTDGEMMKLEYSVDEFPKTNQWARIRVTLGAGRYYEPNDGDNFLLDNIYIKQLASKKVTFETNGANETVDQASTIFDSVKLPDVQLTKDGGWQFDGWYRDKGLTEPFDGTGVADDMTVYAKWLKVHTISFVVGEGKGDDLVGTTVTDTVELPYPTTERYEFQGWYKDPELTEPFDGTGVTGDMTVYAEWLWANKVEFETNGGDPIEARYTIGTLKNIPTAVWLGYRFDGWFWDQELTKPFDGSGVTEDITVYAAWTKQYKVTFDTRGGEDVAPIYTLEDIAELPKTSKQGFGFAGWYLDPELTNPFDGTGITGDMTVYAKYDNLIFSEDFENTDGIDYMKQLAPKMYEQYIQQGAGIVTEENGNKAFRIAREAKQGVYFRFPNGGPGLYEIKFKVKFPKSWIGTTKFFTPMSGTTEVVSARHLNYLSIGTSTYFMNRLSFSNDFYEITYVVDTVNKRVGYDAKYIDTITKTPYTESGRGIVFTSKAQGIDGLYLAIGDQNQSDMMTDYYIDDIFVRKIEQASIESFSIEDGAEDIDLMPEIRVNFSTKVDKSSITYENLYIKDEEGNIIPSTITADVENDKSYAVIKPNANLEYEKVYKVCATIDITKDTYNIDKNYEISFKTHPLDFEFESTVLNASTGKVIEDLTEAQNSTVILRLKMRNYAGAENEPYFIGAAIVDTKTGGQYGYIHDSGTIKRGEEKTVLSGQMTLPYVDENYKIQYYIWSAAENRKVLTDIIAVP